MVGEKAGDAEDRKEHAAGNITIGGTIGGAIGGAIADAGDETGDRVDVEEGGEALALAGIGEQALAAGAPTGRHGLITRQGTLAPLEDGARQGGTPQARQRATQHHLLGAEAVVAEAHVDVDAGSEGAQTSIGKGHARFEAESHGAEIAVVQQPRQPTRAQQRRHREAIVAQGVRVEGRTRRRGLGAQAVIEFGGPRAEMPGQQRLAFLPTKERQQRRRLGTGGPGQGEGVAKPALVGGVTDDDGLDVCGGGAGQQALGQLLLPGNHAVLRRQQGVEFDVDGGAVGVYPHQIDGPLLRQRFDEGGVIVDDDAAGAAGAVGEEHREATERLTMVQARGNDGRRVETTGEEGADLDVSIKAIAHGVSKRNADVVVAAGAGHGDGGGDDAGSADADFDDDAGRERREAGKGQAPRGERWCRENLDEGVFVDDAAMGQRRQQGLRLRGKPQRAGIMGDDEGFDADGVTAEPGATQLGVPQAEGELALEVKDGGGAVFEEAPQEHLGVALGLKDSAALQQVVASSSMAIDLAIDDEGVAAIRRAQRLLPPGCVDEGEAGVHKGGAVVDERAGTIGATVTQGALQARERARQAAATTGGVAVVAMKENAADAAHGRNIHSVMRTRFRPAGVVPLEVWDVVVTGGPLHTLPRNQVAAGVVELVQRLRCGEAVQASGKRHSPLPVDHIVVAGGGAVAVAEALEAAAIDAVAAADPVWAGVRGGRSLRGGGSVVDIGQTAIKGEGPNGRCWLPRSNDIVDRAAALAFCAEGIRSACPASSLVLGLPCEIDDDATVYGCSYGWGDGDASFVDEVLAAAGVGDDVPVLLLNDAELAALAVPASAPARTLLLTVGFGVGAAWMPQQSSRST